MPVSVDRELYYSSAECAHRARDVFTFVDGFGEVSTGREATDDDPRVTAAAESCPSQAIRLTQPG
ncbi:ferredoxin [Streptomyces sp. TE5632]